MFNGGGIIPNDIMDLDALERRFTRSALTELISTPRTRATHILTDDVRANIARNTSASPTASPEELVIQQRGRKKMPVTWSPDVDCAKRQGSLAKTDRTPVKTPQKTSIVLRSTPRKRLLLTDPRDAAGTPEKQAKKTPSPWKRARVERVSASAGAQSPGAGGVGAVASASPLQTALKGLSPYQLIGLIEGLLGHHPDLEKEIASSLPAPDLDPLEEKLTYLKGNIFKSLPTSRLTSKTDSPAYSRAATHLNAFKKCVIDQGKILMEGQHWVTLTEYAAIAWRYVRDTPLWDNPPHNNVRKQCFHTLATMVVHALRKGTWTRAQIESVLQRFKKFEDDTREAEANVKQVIAMCKSKLQ